MTRAAQNLLYIAFYPSDWLARTRGLTPAETGIYITLVCMMYERQVPLPFDRPRLARMCNCPAGPFSKLLRALIDQNKLIETSEGLWNRRVGEEIEAARRAMKEASDRGKAAAAARWGDSLPARNEREIATVNPQSIDSKSTRYTAENSIKIIDSYMPEQCPRSANQNQNQNLHGGGSARGREAEKTLRERILIACCADPVSGLTGSNGNTLGSRIDMDQAARWEAELGLDHDTIVAVVTEAMARKRDDPPSRFAYFDKAMAREARRRLAPRLTPATDIASPAYAGHGITVEVPEEFRDK